LSLDVIAFLFDNITLFLLFVALSVFVYIAFAAKSIKKFQFQFSIFIIIWIISELVNLMPNDLYADLVQYSSIGLEIHLASMMFFGLLIWIRYISSTRGNKKFLDNLEESLK